MAMNAKVAGLYVDITANTAALQKALNDAGVQTKRWSSDMRAQTHEAKGALVLLGEEIGVHIPRHLQGFIAKLPGVGTAMSAAFNNIAVIALISLIVEAGMKLYEFVQKNEEAARKNREAWTGIMVSITDTNDQLELTKTKLENAIAKLEHKPQNMLKQSIEESIVAANELGRILDTDMEKIAKNLKEQQASWFWHNNFMGQKGADEAIRISNDATDKFNSIAAGTYSKDAIANPTAARDAVIDEALADARKSLSVAQTRLNEVTANFGGKAPETSSSKQQVRTETQLIAGLLAMRSTSTLKQGVAADQREFDILQGKAQAKSDSDKAGAELFKSMERKLEGLKFKGSVNNGLDENLYWRDQMPRVAGHPEQIREVQAKSMAAAKAYVDEQERQNKAREAIDKEIDDSLSAIFKDAQKVAEDKQKEQDRLVERANEESRKDTSKFEDYQRVTGPAEQREIQLKIDAPGLTDHSIAIREFQNHLDAFNDQLSLNADELDRIAQALASGTLSEGDAAQARAEQQVKGHERQQLEDAKANQARIDANNVHMTTGSQRVITSLDELTNAFTDTAGQISELLTKTINDVNSELLKGMSGQHMDWKKVGKDVADSVAKDALEQSEGRLLKMIGFGDRSKRQKVTTEADEKAGSSGGDTGLAGLIEKWFGGNKSGSRPDGLAGGIMGSGSFLNWANDSDFMGKHFGSLFGSGGMFSKSGDEGEGGSGFSSLLSSLFGKLGGGGGAASGADVKGVGLPIMVGELGPERFTPSVPGRIDTHKASYPGAAHTWNIDARGATDPAAIHAAVQRGIRQAIPQLVTLSNGARDEHTRRAPNSRGPR